MATRMQQRRGTSAEWSAANPILTAGELGFIRDTNRVKIGDGTTVWNSLPELSVNAELLDGLNSTDFLLATGKAADSNLLDGIDSTGFLLSNGVAADSAKLGNVPASSYALKTQVVDPAAASITFTGQVTFGDADTDVTVQRALVVERHARSTTNTYTSGTLTQVVEKSGATTVKTTTLTYTNGTLTQVVEVGGGFTITTNLLYTSGVLTGTTRTVA